MQTEYFRRLRAQFSSNQHWGTTVKLREVSLILTLVLWLLWKSHPDVLICATFWISVIWTIRAKNLTRTSAGFLILLGVVLNAAVTEINGGVMPVVGMPVHFHAASSIWQSARGDSRFLFLADRASLRFFSIGDLVLISGSLMTATRLSIDNPREFFRTAQREPRNSASRADFPG